MLVIKLNSLFVMKVHDHQTYLLISITKIKLVSYH